MASQEVASAKKRNREGDDDSVDNNNEVDFQELIDLHDEAGLSTDELRRRYYMTSQDDLEYKQPAIAKRSKQTN